MAILLALPYSPWSEKARWALEARRVPFTYRRYSPLLGEPMLRVKLRRLRGPVTVPVLIDDDGAVMPDSAEIARWADARGEGPVLFPPGEDVRMTRFIELSERGLAAGRGASLMRLLVDEEALLEMVPKRLRSMRAVAIRLGALGVRRTLHKYGAAGFEGAHHARALAAALDELRTALRYATARGGVKTLLGGFSFADVAASQILSFVEPPRFGLRLGAASRRSFTDGALRERYADLVAWRDALYEAHRPR
jgi:glutathione S-transferase